MIPIYDVKTIHIEVTNSCNLICANCTRFVGHHNKTFFMDLDTVRKAIDSLEGYPHGIGLMGGEPTMHPKFFEICKIFQEMIPRSQRQFWTNGYKWKEYENLIFETFDRRNIVYNDHSIPSEGVHQPLLVAAIDIVENEDKMWQLIGKCWIQERWSASITPRGAFFCEVAAAQDHLYNGPGGWPIEKGWWKKDTKQFQDQVRQYCPNCSAAIPMPRPSAHDEKDTISKTIAKKLEEAGSPRFKKGKVRLFDKKMTNEEIDEYAKNWTPWSHRAFKQYTPYDIVYE